uniref:Uncharacterized protein n=1 Tax=Oryctolagus cuniculus TaxID=9986 RepID=A0A5F9DFL5_RABIT
PSPSLGFLVGTRGHSASSVSVSVGFPSCESRRPLPLQTFGPGPAGLGSAAAQGGRHDLRGQVEVVPEILDALVASRLERLHGLHDVEVGHVLVRQLRVLRHVHVLFGYHHPLLEEEFVNGNAILLGHQHRGGCRVRSP